MTENKRIFWNIIATYGRSLYSLALGLFTARWALNALGVVDYGLYGVIGGLVVFVSFINSTLAVASSRFYAISIGKTKSAAEKEGALEECRMWFNTALTIHAVVPFALIVIGYPVGVWAIKNFLTIPPDRIADCIWVFRFTCLACFVGMLNVPFSAMYNAKQYIAELTVYSYVTTTANAFFLYYMITHPGAWLFRYALWCCLVSVIPQLVICLRALYVFPECSIQIRYIGDFGKIRQVGVFAAWNLMGVFCALLRTQGISVLVNKVFGPSMNAAFALANSVNAHVATLSSSLLSAFSPAITTAYGARDYARMKNLSYRMSKFGTVLFLLFALPFSLEIKYVLTLWLKTPPDALYLICLTVLAMHLSDVLTHGHMIAINATGRVREYQLSMTKISILTLPLAVITVVLKGGLVGLLAVILVCRWVTGVRRIYYARQLAGLSVSSWLVRVFVPICCSVFCSLFIGGLCREFIRAGMVRLFVITMIAEIVFSTFVWLMVFDSEERFFVRMKFLEKVKEAFK